MTMQIGDSTASSGMAQAIYDQMAANMEPSLDGTPEADRVPIREGWQKLAHAIATGVVTHIQENLELLNDAASAAPELTVEGSTGAAEPAAGHTHPAGTLTVTIDNIVFR
jgi:hypothetical protein